MYLFLKGGVKEKAVGIISFSDTCHCCPLGGTCHREGFVRTLTVGTLKREMCAPAHIGARGFRWTFTIGERMILPASRANEFGVIVFVGARRFNMRVEGLAMVTLDRWGDVFGCRFEGPRDG